MMLKDIEGAYETLLVSLIVNVIRRYVVEGLVVLPVTKLCTSALRSVEMVKALAQGKGISTVTEYTVDVVVGAFTVSELRWSS